MNQQHESASIIAGSEQWVESFPDGVYDDARDVVLDSIEQVERLDPSNRKLLWSGAVPLSSDESVKRICTAHPELPAVLIQSHLIGWLAQGELPGELSDKEIDELDSQMEPWIAELDAFRYQTSAS